MCSTTIGAVGCPEFVPATLRQRMAGSVDRPPAKSAVTHSHSVQIRPFQSGDAGPMYQAARESMDQLCAWMTWCRADFSLAQAESFVSQSASSRERGEQYSFAIIDVQDGSFLGSVGLSHINQLHKFANLGYWVRNSAAGRGVATIAASSAVAFGLTELGLNRVEFLIPAVNIASQRVAQKLGAKFEGMLRNRLVLSGHSHDAAMYSLTKADLRVTG